MNERKGKSAGSGGRQNDEEKFSLKKVPRTLASLPRVLRLVWETHRFLTFSLGILNILQGVVPAIKISITALVIDGVVQAIHQQSPAPIWWPIGLQMGITLLSSLLNALSSIVQQLLQELVSNRIQLEILQKASALRSLLFRKSGVLRQDSSGDQSILVSADQYDCADVRTRSDGDYDGVLALCAFPSGLVASSYLADHANTGLYL